MGKVKIYKNVGVEEEVFDKLKEQKEKYNASSISEVIKLLVGGKHGS